MSVDEKRERLLALLYETRDIFTIKELEKQGNKAKGITAQTVKEIAQSLVDDGTVHCEKIGTSNYYWAFPGAALDEVCFSPLSFFSRVPLTLAV